jgi:hypothetical protein
LIRNPNIRCVLWRVLESIEFNRSEKNAAHMGEEDSGTS